MSQPTHHSCLRFHPIKGQTHPMDEIVFKNDIEPYYAAIKKVGIGSTINMILEYSEGNLQEVAKYFPNPINEATDILLMLQGSNGTYDRTASIEVSHLPGLKLELKVTKLNS